MSRLTLLAVLALAALTGCGGAEEHVADDRRSIEPIVCRTVDGQAIPGTCFA